MDRNIALFVIVAVSSDVASPSLQREPHLIETPPNHAAYIPAPARVTTTLATGGERYLFVLNGRGSDKP